MTWYVSIWAWTPMWFNHGLFYCLYTIYIVYTKNWISESSIVLLNHPVTLFTYKRSESPHNRKLETVVRFTEIDFFCLVRHRRWCTRDVCDRCGNDLRRVVCCGVELVTCLDNAPVVSHPMSYADVCETSCSYNCTSPGPKQCGHQILTHSEIVKTMRFVKIS